MKKVFPFCVSGAARLDFSPLSIEFNAGTVRFRSPDIQSMFESVAGLCRADVKSGDFKRGDDKVRAYIIAACAALESGAETNGIGIGTFDWGIYGCHEQNKHYFTEYLLSGKRAHGRMFVGTLPTTPMCESAISLNLTGPAYYTDTLGNFQAALCDASLLLDETPAKRLLFFNYTPLRLVVLLLAPGETYIDEKDTIDTLYLEALKK